MSRGLPNQISRWPPYPTLSARNLLQYLLKFITSLINRAINHMFFCYGNIDMVNIPNSQ